MKKGPTTISEFPEGYNIYRKKVEHPGIRPRRFDYHVYLWLTRAGWYGRVIKNALEKGKRRALSARGLTRKTPWTELVNTTGA